MFDGNYSLMKLHLDKAKLCSGRGVVHNNFNGGKKNVGDGDEACVYYLSFVYGL